MGNNFRLGLIRKLFILPISLIMSALCISCTLFGDHIEVFHKPEIVDGPFDTFFADEKGNTYFYYESRLYKCNSKEKCERANVSFDENYELVDKCHCIGNDFWYFYVTLIEKKVSGIDRIVITDKDFKIVDYILTDDTIRDMVVWNGYLYYCYDYWDASEEPNHEYCVGLSKIDLSTLKKTVIHEKCVNGNVYHDEETSIFLQLYPVEHHIMVVGENYFCSSYSEFICFQNDYGTISSRINGDLLYVEYQNKSLSFSLPFKKTRFYDYVYARNNSLIFAVNEYIKNEQCVPTWAEKCICHYGRSLLYKFDLNSGCLSMICEYESGTVLVDYDENGSSYYFDGGLYFHGRLVNECHKITPEEEIAIKNNDYFHHDSNHWFISLNDENGQLYLF